MKCTTRGRWTRYARARARACSRSCTHTPRARRQPSVIRGGVRGATVRRRRWGLPGVRHLRAGGALRPERLVRRGARGQACRRPRPVIGAGFVTPQASAHRCVSLALAPRPHPRRDLPASASTDGVGRCCPCRRCGSAIAGNPGVAPGERFQTRPPITASAAPASTGCSLDTAGKAARRSPPPRRFGSLRVNRPLRNGRLLAIYRLSGSGSRRWGRKGYGSRRERFFLQSSTRFRSETRGLGCGGRRTFLRFCNRSDGRPYHSCWRLGLQVFRASIFKRSGPAHNGTHMRHVSTVRPAGTGPSTFWPW
jgi:hypothetical protein